MVKLMYQLILQRKYQFSENLTLFGLVLLPTLKDRGGVKWPALLT